MIDSESARTDPATGAVHELARDDVARKRFLRMAGKTMGAGAAASGLAAFVAACGGKSKSSSSSAAPPASTSTSASSGSGGDLGIVNYALTLEYLEAEFYDKVAASGLFHGSTLATLKTFGAEEHEHVAALRKVAASMGAPAAKPTG